MPSGLGHPVNGYPSGGKHLSIGSEYPDSPCGSGSDLVSRLEDVTCRACLAVLIEQGDKAAKLMQSLRRCAPDEEPPVPEDLADELMLRIAYRNGWRDGKDGNGAINDCMSPTGRAAYRRGVEDGSSGACTVRKRAHMFIVVPVSGEPEPEPVDHAKEVPPSAYT